MNNMRGLHCDNSTHAWCPLNMLTLHCSSISHSLFPFFKQWLVGFIILSSYIYMQCTSILFTPQYPFLALPPPRKPLKTLPVIIVLIILGLSSTNGQEHAVFGLLSLVYLAQHDDLQFHPFSLTGCFKPRNKTS
jgi:hypothetical protein